MGASFRMGEACWPHAAAASIAKGRSLESINSTIKETAAREKGKGGRQEKGERLNAECGRLTPDDVRLATCDEIRATTHCD
jgi:hypothetical protein